MKKSLYVKEKKTIDASDKVWKFIYEKLTFWTKLVFFRNILKYILKYPLLHHETFIKLVLMEDRENKSSTHLLII